MANDIKAVREKVLPVKNCEQQLRDQIKVNQQWMEAWFPNLELVSRNQHNRDKDADRVTDIMHVIVFITTVTLRDKLYPLKVFSSTIACASSAGTETIRTNVQYLFMQKVKVYFCVKVASVPIVIISQTSQDCMARGTLAWNAVFSDPVSCRLALTCIV